MTMTPQEDFVCNKTIFSENQMNVIHERGNVNTKKKKWISNKLLIIGSTNYPYARSTNYRDKNQIVHSPLADI